MVSGERNGESCLRVVMTTLGSWLSSCGLWSDVLVQAAVSTSVVSGWKPDPHSRSLMSGAVLWSLEN